jgi:hypothetical protein
MRTRRRCFQREPCLLPEDLIQTARRRAPNCMIRPPDTGRQPTILSGLDISTRQRCYQTAWCLLREVSKMIQRRLGVLNCLRPGAPKGLLRSRSLAVKAVAIQSYRTFSRKRPERKRIAFFPPGPAGARYRSGAAPYGVWTVPAGEASGHAAWLDETDGCSVVCQMMSGPSF